SPEGNALAAVTGGGDLPLFRAGPLDEAASCEVAAPVLPRVAPQPSVSNDFERCTVSAARPWTGPRTVPKPESARNIRREKDRFEFLIMLLTFRLRRVSL